jgi:hypothetical protein
MLIGTLGRSLVWASYQRQVQPAGKSKSQADRQFTHGRSNCYKLLILDRPSLLEKAAIRLTGNHGRPLVKASSLGHV